MPRPVALLVRSYHPATGVGADIDGMRAVLQEEGVEARVFAHKSEGDAESFEGFREYSQERNPVVIYHHAIAWPAGVRAFQRARGPRIFRYHNVTPARFFVWHSLAYAAGSVLGRQEARSICANDGIDRFVGASEFSTLDLATLGADPTRCATLAPFEPPALSGIEPDETVAQALASYDGIKLLFVGRLLPHKGQGHLIRGLSRWVERYDEDAHLYLVGGDDPRVETYRIGVERLASRLGIEDRVELVGSITAAELAAYYAGSDVFVCASQHEGFCIPILEAMRAGLPVVAVAGSAVTETGGNAVTLLPTTDPSDMAAAWRRAALVPETRQELIDAGKTRADRVFGEEAHRSQFLRLVEPLLDA